MKIKNNSLNVNNFNGINSQVALTNGMFKMKQLFTDYFEFKRNIFNDHFASSSNQNVFLVKTIDSSLITS